MDRVPIKYVQSDQLDVVLPRENEATFKTEGRSGIPSANSGECGMWSTTESWVTTRKSCVLQLSLRCRLSLTVELDSALSPLEKFGRQEAASRHFEEFKRLRGHVFESLTPDSAPHGTYVYELMKQYLGRISSRRDDKRTVEEVMAQAFTENYISSHDGARIG